MNTENPQKLWLCCKLWMCHDNLRNALINRDALAYYDSYDISDDDKKRLKEYYIRHNPGPTVEESAKKLRAVLYIMGIETEDNAESIIKAADKVLTRKCAL